MASSHKGSEWVPSFRLCLLLWGDSVDPRYPEEGWVKRPAPPELRYLYLAAPRRRGDPFFCRLSCKSNSVSNTPNPSDLSSVRWESRGMHRQGVVRGSWEVLIPEVS